MSDSVLMQPGQAVEDMVPGVEDTSVAVQETPIMAEAVDADSSETSLRSLMGQRYTLRCHRAE